MAFLERRSFGSLTSPRRSPAALGVLKPTLVFIVSQIYGIPTSMACVISFADPATSPSCESTPGHVAELKKREKHRDHPVFDARLRRRGPVDFVALCFERHGRGAKETVSITKKKLASRRALCAGLESPFFYQKISCFFFAPNLKPPS